MLGVYGIHVMDVWLHLRHPLHRVRPHIWTRSSWLLCHGRFGCSLGILFIVFGFSGFVYSMLVMDLWLQFCIFIDVVGCTLSLQYWYHSSP